MFLWIRVVSDSMDMQQRIGNSVCRKRHCTDVSLFGASGGSIFLNLFSIFFWVF